METDGGLAAAGATLDDEHARRRTRNRLELLGIEQRGDLGKKPVAPADSFFAFAGAEHAAARGRTSGTFARQHCGALTPGESRRSSGQRAPTVAATHVGRFGGADAHETTGDDGDVAPHQHFAFDVFVAEGFLVGIALAVAIVDAAHRRVAPVDDAHVMLRIEVGAATETDVAIASVLAQPQVGEVGIARIERTGGHFLPPRCHRLQSFHLGDERRCVLESRFRELVAQRDQLGVVVATSLDELSVAQRLQDASEHLLFVTHRFGRGVTLVRPTVGGCGGCGGCGRRRAGRRGGVGRGRQNGV